MVSLVIASSDYSLAQSRPLPRTSSRSSIAIRRWAKWTSHGRNSRNEMKNSLFATQLIDRDFDTRDYPPERRRGAVMRSPFAKKVAMGKLTARNERVTEATRMTMTRWAMRFTARRFLRRMTCVTGLSHVDRSMIGLLDQSKDWLIDRK